MGVEMDHRFFQVAVEMFAQGSLPVDLLPWACATPETKDRLVRVLGLPHEQNDREKGNPHPPGVSTRSFVRGVSVTRPETE